MKKALAFLAVVAMMAYAAAPAMAVRYVRVVNVNLIGANMHTIGAASSSGGETVVDTDGEVNITNSNTSATSDGVTSANGNLTDVGEPMADSRYVAVWNVNGVMLNDSAVISTASTGGDTVVDTDDDVTVNNGSATSSSSGFVLTNTNITRVR